MLLPVIALLCLWQVLGDPIIGGQPSQVNKYPWVVSIQRDGYHKCGGTIISNITILTAAHCTKHPPESYVVRVGSTRTDSGGSWHYVTTIRQHEYFINATRSVFDLLNDVALIKLSPPIELDKYGAQIQLVEKKYFAVPGTNASVVGWGSTLEGGEMMYELKSVNLRVIDSGECARAYGDKSGTWVKRKHLICASDLGRGACHGDSGGPLIIEEDNIQFGIVSGGLACGNHRHPEIYQNIPYSGIGLMKI